MGITCAIREYPSASYNRCLGFWWGVSSGSRTSVDNVTDTTCMGVAIGNGFYYRGGYNPPWNFIYYNDPNSGSFFYPTVMCFQAYTTGTLAYNSAYAPSNYDSIFPNAADPNQRRGLFLIELSSSSATAFQITICGFASSSILAKNSNKCYTNGDLAAALTASTWPPTISGSVMDSYNQTLAYNTASFPLSHGFINWQGGVPLEIYDWFVYKVG